MRRLSVTLVTALCATLAPGASAAGGGRAETARGSQTDERAVVWAVGDLATPGVRAERVAALIRRGRPDRLLYLGDVYETGTLGDFRRWYHPRLGRLARITEPTIGNHEWDNRFEGYYRYWFRRKGRKYPPWSKTSIAGWELYNLNSQAPHGTGSPQIQWLERSLANASGDCRIAFWHRPRYSAGAYLGALDLNPFWNRLVGRARIVLSGHDHNLQRHRPQRGIAQYVVGAGGRPRYSLHGENETMAWGTDKVDGALRMLLTPTRAVLEFRSPAGRLLDRSRVPCSPQ